MFCAFSSAGSSNGLLIRGSWVRAPQGALCVSVQCFCSDMLFMLDSYAIVSLPFSGEVYSRVAQLAERSTVNRMVPGSSPGAGAF